eukprot:327808-Pleurochrysis_carterae.AAC.6
MLSDEELLGRAGLLRPNALIGQTQVGGAEASSREASTKPSEAPSLRKRCSARSWHLAIAESEALAAVSCCVVHRFCKSCRKVKRGTRLSDHLRAAANVRSENHGIGRAGIATVKTVVLMSASVSKAASSVEDSRKGCTMSPRQATRP